MGRSVCVPQGAKAVVYLDCSDLQDSWEWDDFVDYLRHVIRRKYKSFGIISEQVGREYHAILENAHGMVIVSEYMGLVSVSLGCSPKSDNEGMSIAWCESVAENFEALLKKAYKGQALSKMGTFSNGEAVYQRI